MINVYSHANHGINLFLCISCRFAFRKLRKGGGQIYEQGSFEGAGLAHGKLGGSV